MRRPFVWFVLGLAVGIIGGMYLTGLKAAAAFIFCVAAQLGFSYKNRISNICMDSSACGNRIYFVPFRYWNS